MTPMATDATYAGDLSQFAKRVLIITQSLAVPFDRHVWQEAKELVQQGYIVSVICPKGKGCDASRETLSGVHFFRYPESPAPSGSAMIWQVMLAYRVFLTNGFDVIHAVNPPDSIFIAGCVFKFFFGRKFIYEQRAPVAALSEGGGRRRGSFRLWLEHMSFDLADVTISANESCRNIAIKRGKKPPEKVFVVRPSPDPERIKTLPALPSLKQGRKNLVACAGLLNNKEGIHLLIETLRIITQDMKRSDVQFALVGESPLVPGFRKFAAMLGVSDNLSFTGFLPEDEMLQVLCTADICVNPDAATPAGDSITSEEIIEYMALGRPIVQFEATENRAAAGEASLYAAAHDARDMAEKIVALLDDPARRREMSAIGRARIENELAWGHQAPRLLAAYEALFAESKKVDPE